MLLTGFMLLMLGWSATAVNALQLSSPNYRLCNMHSLPDRWSDKDPPRLPTPAQEWLQGKFCRKPPYFTLVHASTPGFPYFFPELTDPYRSTRQQHWSDWPSGTWQSRPRHWSSVTASARKDSWHGGPWRPMAAVGASRRFEALYVTEVSRRLNMFRNLKTSSLPISWFKHVVPQRVHQTSVVWPYSKGTQICRAKRNTLYH